MKDSTTSPDNTDTPDAEESPLHEKNDQEDDLPGELADIIRDLTSRPSS